MLQEQCNSESTAERIRGERNVASMHTVMDSGASKFMDAMPLAIFMKMSDQQYKSGVWNYLGLSIGPVNPGSLRCQCGTLMSHPDHPHTYVHLGGARIGRHDTCKNA